MLDASHLLAAIVVFGVVLVTLALVAPNVALALINAIERLVGAIWGIPKAIAQKAKRK